MTVLWSAFLCSGFAALLYQIIWQRVLFRIYGIDIASVTVVVTAFMLGLGVGSLAGGALSRRGRRLPEMFALCEVGVGIFGFLSLHLFDWVASWTLDVPRSMTGVVAFLLVLVPTTLMGASLPLLVEFEARRERSVGRSVGLLYFINTLGAALGALFAVVFLLGALGLRSATNTASVLNVALGVAVLIALRGKETPA